MKLEGRLVPWGYSFPHRLNFYWSWWRFKVGLDFPFKRVWTADLGFLTVSYYRY